MSVIYFVRHGESEANLTNSVNDDPARQVKLTAAGRLQSSACAKIFQSIPLTHAFSSEFPRAQETLGFLLHAHPQITYRVDARLNEWRTGMDGKSLDYLHQQIEKGVSLPETFDDVLARVQPFVDELRHLGESKNVLVVSHKITIIACMVAAGELAKEEAKRVSVNNCEILSVTLQP